MAKWIGIRKGEVLNWDENSETALLIHEQNRGKNRIQTSSILLRKEAMLKANIKSAVARVCGVGLYEFSVNGQKADDRVLAPLVTDYKKRVLYDIYDITDKVVPGQNAFCIELGNGYFCNQEKWWGWRMKWYGTPRALAWVEVLYEDGTADMFVSDKSWKIADGPAIFNSIYDGEWRDANREPKGWKYPGFDDGKWSHAEEVEAPTENLQPNIYEPIRVCKELKPIRVYVQDSQKTVYDFGENISGWVRIALKGPQYAEVTIRHGEGIHEDGTIDCTTNRTAMNTDKYILKGEGTEIFEPKFTFHGFQYAEVSCSDGSVEVEEITALFVHSDIRKTGRFECSDPKLNRLHEVNLRSKEASFMGFPMDCPQRDERLGWLGDAYITSEASLYNYDMRLFYDKWLDDIRYGCHTENGSVPHIAPRPEIEPDDSDFSSGYSIVVWEYYKFCGDKSVIERHYDRLKDYIGYLWNMSENYILPMGRYGDWMSCLEGWKRGEPYYTNSMYFHYNLINIEKMAEVLNLSEDVRKYTRMREEMKTIMIEKYYDSASHNFGDGTQFSNAFALVLGLVPEEETKAVAKSLVMDIKERGYALTTGIFGTKYVMDALCDHGYGDVAMKLLLREEYPGWMYLIKGRTTLPENWQGGGSGNHCMFGSVDAVFYKMLAGIKQAEGSVGFQNVVIRPHFAYELEYVKAECETVKGVIRSCWERIGDEINVTVRIPEGCTGTFVHNGSTTELRQGENTLRICAV